LIFAASTVKYAPLAIKNEAFMVRFRVFHARGTIAAWMI
jgi:hypothetical protein